MLLQALILPWGASILGPDVNISVATTKGGGSTGSKNGAKATANLSTAVGWRLQGDIKIETKMTSDC